MLQESKGNSCIQFLKKVDIQMQLRLFQYDCDKYFVVVWMSDFMLDANLLFVSNTDVLTVIQTQKLRALQ